eukprot:4810055-Amphidinium_carterae.1
MSTGMTIPLAPPVDLEHMQSYLEGRNVGLQALSQELMHLRQENLRLREASSAEYGMAASKRDAGIAEVDITVNMLEGTANDAVRLTESCLREPRSSEMSTR